MSEENTNVYTIPVDDKFVIYAPLKSIAFIGNKALVSVIYQKLQDPLYRTPVTNELVNAFEKTGIFTPDKKRFPSCGCDEPFNPSLCILMPTTACNLACTYCYAASDNRKHTFLKWPVAKKAIDIAFNNSVKFKKGKFAISFHGGGEPTLPGEFFFKASEYARKLDPDCAISVTTNAVWDNNFTEQALNFLTEISISIDGNEVTQNRQRPDARGNGTFSRVMKTISEIEKRDISYGIRITVTKESLPELRSNVEFFCRETKCKSFQVEAVYNQGRAIGAGLAIDDIDAFVDVFMEVHHYAKERGKTVHYSSARPHLTTNTFCTATSNALIVTTDGEMTACYEVFDHSHVLAEDFIIGRIDLNNGMVLYPGKREKLQNKISDNRIACKDCFCYYHCAGDCPPKALLSHLNNDKFRCSVTRAITLELILDKIEESGGIWLGNQHLRKSNSNVQNQVTVNDAESK